MSRGWRELACQDKVARFSQACQSAQFSKLQFTACRKKAKMWSPRPPACTVSLRLPYTSVRCAQLARISERGAFPGDGIRHYRENSFPTGVLPYPVRQQDSDPSNVEPNLASRTAHIRLRLRALCWLPYLLMPT